MHTFLLAFLFVQALTGHVFSTDAYKPDVEDVEDIMQMIATLSHQVDQLQSKLADKKIRHSKDVEAYSTVSSKEKDVFQQQYDDALEDVEHDLVQKLDTPDTYGYSDYGCYLDVIQLECPAGQTIFINDAFFGQFSYACDQECCVPHPTRDCVESLQQNAPQDYLAMKLKCDYNRTCQFLHQGGLVDTCTSPYDAQYVIVYYSCLPETLPAFAPIGFTAVPTASKYYTLGEVLLFNVTLSNIGGNYRSESSMFICPYDGLYVFSVTVASTPGANMIAELRHENSTVLTMVGNSEDVHQGSSIAVVDCMKNDRVFVQSYGDNYYLRSDLTGRWSSFSGYLAYPY